MINLPPADPPEVAQDIYDEIRPIAPPDHLPDHLDAAPSKKASDFYSKCVFILALLLALFGVIGSAIAFAGFAENDQNITHLISAFALCFGIGALLFGPMTLIAIYARRAINKPLPRLRAVIVLLLVLPWFVLGYFIFQLGASWRFISLIGVFAALFILFWAARFLRSGTTITD